MNKYTIKKGDKTVTIKEFLERIGKIIWIGRKL